MERGRDRLENAVRAVRERAEEMAAVPEPYDSDFDFVSFMHGWHDARRCADARVGRLLEERDEARRVAGALYRLYLAVKDYDWDYFDEHDQWIEMYNAETVLAEAARRA